MTGFLLGLIGRAAATAFVVVGATVAAEVAGPFWGGLIVSLPVAAGPAYVMLALQHDAAFRADAVPRPAVGGDVSMATPAVSEAAISLTRWPR